MSDGERRALGALDREAFVRLLGGAFEHSPWVAEAAWARAPFASVDEVHTAMVEAMRAAPHERLEALVRAHPDLAGKAAIAGNLTAESRGEQAAAGLDRLTPEEHLRFRALNRRYRERFGFPFIMAVKGADKHRILAAFEERMGNPPEVEFERALAEIARIARFRLEALIE